MHDIPLGVCTTAYNMLDIRDHIVDFLDPFRQGYFYRESMHGSFSIKKVLPALFPDDKKLDYHNLSGSVHNGGDAMNIYPKMAQMTFEEREQTLRIFSHTAVLIHTLWSRFGRSWWR